MRRSAAVVTAVGLVVSAVVAGAAAPASASVLAERAPEGTVYFIGDSWAAGLFADPEHTLAQDAADDLGMASDVDAQSGTGYLTAPLGRQTYVQRAASIPAGTDAQVVVIQGGSNDVGKDPDDLRQAVERTVAEVRRALPTAEIVLLGPGPDPWPVTAAQDEVDLVLEAAASAEAVDYVSPLQEGWFTADDVDDVIDPVTHHPTVSGDEILGRLVAADLARLLPGLHLTRAASEQPSRQAARHQRLVAIERRAAVVPARSGRPLA